MNSKKDGAWFPAKKYGYGWGFPACWQGWVVMFIFGFLLISGAIVLLPEVGTTWFVLYAMTLCAALTFVCWLKGEKPRWRWGND